MPSLFLGRFVSTTELANSWLQLYPEDYDAMYPLPKAVLVAKELDYRSDSAVLQYAKYQDGYLEGKKIDDGLNLYQLQEEVSKLSAESDIREGALVLYAI